MISLRQAINNWERFHVFWILLFALFALTEVYGRNDFDIFLEASRSLWNGDDIFSLSFFDGYHYYYSTLFAIFITPLTWIPVVVAKVLWIAFQVWMLYRLLGIFQEILPKGSLPSRLIPFVTLILLLLVFRFIKSNIHLGQATILILWLTTEAFRNLQHGKMLMAGFCLAVAIDIKMLPLVMLPYLLYRAYWKSFFATISFFILINLVPAIFIGMQQQNSLLESRWNLLNPVQDKHLFDVEETSFHSLTTVIPILCMEDSGDRSTVPIDRHICNLAPEQVKWIIQFLRIILIATTLWFLRTIPFKPSLSRDHAWWEFSYLLLAIPLIFPHQQHYAFLMAWPAMIWQFRFLTSETSDKKFRLVRIVLFTIVFICFNGGILLGFWRAELEHFKVVTLGALVLIILQATSPPVKSIKPVLQV